MNTDKLAQLICSSFQDLLGRPLLPGPLRPLPPLEALRAWDHVVLSHTSDEDPVFWFANPAAQKLFRIEEEAFLGMPSRLSAEAPLRSERQELLDTVSRQGYIDHYTGVRIRSDGTRFRIHKAIVWNLVDKDGNINGQAATFHQWTDLPAT